MRSILTISTDMLSTIQTFVLAHLKNILPKSHLFMEAFPIITIQKNWPTKWGRME